MVGFKIQYGEIYRIILLLTYRFSLTFKIQYGEIYSYRSSLVLHYVGHLKSSMERFIGITTTPLSLTEIDLKSSMERFIVYIHISCVSQSYIFKIQYGEIYSFSCEC